MASGEPILDLEAIAEAFRTISKAVSYRELAESLLKIALEASGADRGAVVLSKGGALLAKFDASFPREKANILVSSPSTGQIAFPHALFERALRRQEAVLEPCYLEGSAFLDGGDPAFERGIALLCQPLIHQEQTIGVLYLESAPGRAVFTRRCVSLMSMLALQATVSFECALLVEALRETNSWMMRGQQIGRMGSYRWNTRTLLSRGSRECYRILDLDLNVNPVPFEAFRDRIHPDDLAMVTREIEAAVRSRSAFSQEYRVVHRDGTVLHVLAVGEFDIGPSGDLELEGIIADITERKAAEQAATDTQAELARTARLASLGEFAGSIIHEVSQPLAGLIMNAEACERWITRDPVNLTEAHRSLARVIKQGRRTGNVISSLRNLVREGPLQLGDVEIEDAIMEVLLLSKRDIDRAGVALRTEFDPGMRSIEADRVQFQQVVLNLVRNGIEAMADVQGRLRALTISSKREKDFVSVSVVDSGVGIAPDLAEHLFEPLYTTKDRGLGLGLAICRKIIAAHGGQIWAERNGCHGTNVTFMVPVRR